MSLSPLNPIQMLPARDRVASALREAILSHQFEEGQELTLKDTAAQLGVSATPIREAFQMLAREGLIELRPNRGAIVLGMSEKRIRDHYETRAALERAAVVLVCRRKADLSAIENAYNQAEEALANNDSKLYSEQNQAFHMAIWEAADNDNMKELLSSMWNGLSMGHKVTQEHYAHISMEEHKKILSALEARNERLAAELMEAHIMRSLVNVLSHLNKNIKP
jgi:DNA-binding GntR family transcriptional regulator